ncbi:hypothetical protein [Streptomyces sp. NPDC058861]|uniref:hypothetical protein n=1 Tax=Streptomyces sp. NPDC058861 TaxID=3346653 RepID=UPI0036A6DCE6
MLPTLKTWSPREKVTSALMNQQIRDVHKWLENPPYFECKRSEAYTLTGGATAVLPWNSESSNGFTFTKDASNRVTSVSPKYRGRYMLHMQLCGKVSAPTCHLYVDFLVNGAVRQIGVIDFESASFMDSVRITALLRLEAGDVLSTRVYASSGRTATLTSSADQQLATVFYGYWMGA